MQARTGTGVTGRKRQSRARSESARRGGSIAADILLFFAAATLTMAGVFMVTSFTQNDSLAGDAGRMLARTFAGALAVSGVLVGLLGIGFLGESRNETEHYVVPGAAGILAGGVGATLFLAQAGQWLWAPALLVFFALRPVRRRLTGSGRRR